MHVAKLKTFFRTSPGLASLALLSVMLFAFPSAALDQTLQNKVDEYISACVKLGIFSGSVLIAKDGNILVSKGYGMANHEHGVPNTSQTKFRLGSMTKQFTAAAIMQLQERGKLKVEDSLDTYIPDYPNGDQITLHHLLTHASGIPDLTDFPEHQQTIMIPSPVEKTILRFKNKPLEFTPGEQFKYSNSGYLLLGTIIEKES